MHPTTLDDWLEYIGRRHPEPIALGLERLRTVAGRLALARPARTVVTVAGTNGKGSTVALIEAVARAGGCRVGSYTSPHLLRFNERIRIDGVEADDAAITGALEQVDAARGDVELTYFEFATLAALLLFAGHGLDLAILEVGLGGRLDAVNLVDPDIAVITSIALDHQQWLGADREAIGREKAGILRRGKPLVLAEDEPPEGVLALADAGGARVIRAGVHYRYRVDGARWHWCGAGLELDLPRPALAAPAQLANAAAAIAALQAAGLAPVAAAIAQGLLSARPAGRLQRWTDTHGVEFVLDVAHNPAASAQLADWSRACPPVGRCDALLGVLADKDVAGLVTPLAGVVSRWWAAGLVRDSPRGLEAAALAAAMAGALPAASIHRRHDVAAALAAARRGCGRGDRLLVFGSFFTVAAALRALQPDPPSAPV